ncbi:MAG: hypothetical protein DLM70_16405 [Chloroflexi bacterium]|nr:MAG: hypothetical protein DLM70_16405 [Chloroflexota bacterium]
MDRVPRDAAAVISFTNPLALLLTIPFIALALFAWRHASSNLSPQRLRLATAVRVTILLALILSLSGTRIRVPQSHQSVIVVADLSASDYGLRSAAQAFINGAATQRPAGDTLGVVDVGRQPVVEQPVGQQSGFSGFQSAVDSQYTNLGGGLDLANALLPGGYQHRVVVMSDGQQNVGDAIASARLLRSQGVRVDVVPLRVPSGAEVLVENVSVPAQLRPRESFAVTITVHSTAATTTGLTILRDRTLLGSVQEKVRPGENHYVFQQSPLPSGFYTYEVEITPARDTQPENNQGSAFTSVQSSPRALIITDQPREAVNVLASLKSTGIQADLRTPGKVTPELTFLQRYAAVVIVDTPADSLGSQLMAQLVPYVRDLGHGLVVIGGQNAYSMGGYGQTPLEQVLPVSMDLPKHQNLPTTAVALIIESLEEDTQINISKEAGKGVVSLLTPQDLVEVSDAPFDGTAGWVVPLQHVSDRGGIGGAIDRMVPGDPDSYLPMLQSAYDTLRHANAKVKHIVLLGDGDAEDPAYQQLVQQIHASGITVSTVSTNGLGRNDFQTMRNIALWGGGRYYTANDPSKIPQIFLRETRTVARLGIVQGKFFPQELSANPMVRDVRRVPPLYGYVGTTPKAAAEVVLASAKLDPILAAWQFGLGRSVAWTSDAAGLWTKDWLRAPNANRFWANLVSWVFPAAGTGRLFVTASSSQGQGHIAVSVPPSLGPSPAVMAHVLSRGLTTNTIQLEPAAPGEYDGSFQESGQGAYFVTVEAHGAGRAAAGQIGLGVPYSPEYRTTGVNTPFLQALAGAGGGSVLTGPQATWRGNLQSVLAHHDLTLWLLLLAVLMLPIDIGVRRLVVSRREIETIAAALPFVRTAPAAHEPAIPLMNALRERRVRGDGPVVRSTAGESRGIRLPRKISPSSGPRRSYTRSESGADEEQEGETVAGRLLAAKRKKA